MHRNNLIRNYNKISQPNSSGKMTNNSNNNQQFYQQMMMAKAEQMKKIKNVSELGLTRDQITDMVICPIKVERSNRSEIDRYVSDEESKLAKKYIEENLWKNRTNAPYKNILKNEDWKKKFKSSADLIVHKVSNFDKIGLLDEYNKLVGLMEKHNNELRVIYSTTKEAEHKKEFEYVNIYKYNVKYDPKNYNDLKEFYKKEQKKLENEQKRIDHIINKLIDDDITVEDIKLLEDEFLSSNKNIITNQVDELDKQIMELLDHDSTGHVSAESLDHDSVGGGSADSLDHDSVGGGSADSLDHDSVGGGSADSLDHDSVGGGSADSLDHDSVGGGSADSVARGSAHHNDLSNNQPIDLPKISRIKIKRASKSATSLNPMDIEKKNIMTSNKEYYEKPKRGATIVRKIENKINNDNMKTNQTTHTTNDKIIRRIKIVRATN